MIDVERFSEAARFARKAVEREAHLNPPKGSKLQAVQWERNVDMTLTYLFGAEEGVGNTRYFSLADVGKIFPKQDGSLLTRERVRQIVTSTVLAFYHNSPQDLQSQNSPEQLERQIGKPKFLTHPVSTIRNILAELDMGADYQALSGKYSRHDKEVLRRALGQYGVDVPVYEPHHKGISERLKKVGPRISKPILRELLTEITVSFIQNHRQVFDRHLTFISVMLRRLGFYFARRDLGIFLDKLNQADIPFGRAMREVETGSRKGERHYYFVFHLQEARIRRVLLADRDLNHFLQNPIRQVAGVRISELPNTYQLQNSGDYGRILTLCKRLGIRVGGSRIDELLSGCLVPIFRYHSHGVYYYPKRDEGLLSRFLLQAKRGAVVLLNCD